MHCFHYSVISKLTTNRRDTTIFSEVYDVIGYVLRTTLVHYERVVTFMLLDERSPDLHISLVFIFVNTIGVLLVFQLFLHIGPAKTRNGALLVAPVTTASRLALPAPSYSGCV